MKFPAPFFCAVLLFSCAGIKLEEGELDLPDNSSLFILGMVSPENFHTKEMTIRMLQKSGMRIGMTPGGSIDNNLGGDLISGFQLDSYYIIRTNGVRRKLFYQRPPVSLTREWKRAERFGEAGRKGPAKNSIQQFLKSAPDYYKNYTMAGKVLLMVGLADKAVNSLAHAIRLNSADYEAHLYLARAWKALGNKNEAVKSYTSALMLNKHDKQMRSELEGLLKEMKMRIRPDRLVFNFRLDQQSLRGFNMSFETGKEATDFAMAQCVACWKYKPGYAQEMLQGKPDPMELIMYKECLMAQAMEINRLMREEPNLKIPENFRWLMAAVQARLIDAIIIWEIVASYEPYAPILASDKQKEDMCTYIMKYVYEPYMEP